MKRVMTRMAKPCYPTQADMPRAPAIADATAMMMRRMISQVLFSLFCSMFVFLVIISPLRRGVRGMFR